MAQIEYQNSLSTKSLGGMKIGIATFGDTLAALIWAVGGLYCALNAIYNQIKSF